MPSEPIRPQPASVFIKSLFSGSKIAISVNSGLQIHVPSSAQRSSSGHKNGWVAPEVGPRPRIWRRPRGAAVHAVVDPEHALGEGTGARAARLQTGRPRDRSRRFAVFLDFGVSKPVAAGERVLRFDHDLAVQVDEAVEPAERTRARPS